MWQSVYGMVTVSRECYASSTKCAFTYGEFIMRVPRSRPLEYGYSGKGVDASNQNADYPLKKTMWHMRYFIRVKSDALI